MITLYYPSLVLSNTFVNHRSRVIITKLMGAVAEGMDQTRSFALIRLSMCDVELCPIELSVEFTMIMLVTYACIYVSMCIK